MDCRIPLESIFQGATLCGTFLDYTFRSCLNCSSIRHRIAYKNDLREDGIYVNLQGDLWIREKLKFKNILKELELLNRRGPLTRASQSYEEPNRVQSSVEIERHVDIQLQLKVQRHILNLLSFEVRPANYDEQIERSEANRPENENQQQIVDLSAQEDTNENPNGIDTFYNAKNAFKRFLQKSVAYRSRRRKLPSHLKCRMFLNELFGRQTYGPMREMDMIALANKAVPYHIHSCMYAFEIT